MSGDPENTKCFDICKPEEIVVIMECGHHLPNSGSPFAFLSQDLLKILAQFVEAEHLKHREEAGLVTPPSSPRESIPPHAPRADRQLLQPAQLPNSRARRRAFAGPP
jgi:hypothetical protein